MHWLYVKKITETSWVNLVDPWWNCLQYGDFIYNESFVLFCIELSFDHMYVHVVNLMLKAVLVTNKYIIPCNWDLNGQVWFLCTFTIYFFVIKVFLAIIQKFVDLYLFLILLLFRSYGKKIDFFFWSVSCVLARL